MPSRADREDGDDLLSGFPGKPGSRDVVGPDDSREARIASYDQDQFDTDGQRRPVRTGIAGEADDALSGDRSGDMSPTRNAERGWEQAA